MEITTRTRLVALLGWPVSHSRSPQMQNAAFVSHGLDYVYLGFAVAPGRLGDAVRGLLALGAAGANVTIPHKIAAVGLCSGISAVARQAGAVNTLVFAEGQIIGDNTDVEGLRWALTRVGAELAGKHAAILGAGGAARAAVVALLGVGVDRVTVVSRDTARAEAMLADVAMGVFPPRPSRGVIRPEPRKAELVARPWEPEALRDADVIVGATPPTAQLALDLVPPHALVMDTAYVDGDTPLVAAARARGLEAHDGRLMLACQGALSFRLWTGVEAPLSIMQAALGLSPRGGGAV